MRVKSTTLYSSLFNKYDSILPSYNDLVFRGYIDNRSRNPSNYQPVFCGLFLMWIMLRERRARAALPMDRHGDEPPCLTPGYCQFRREIPGVTDYPCHDAIEYDYLTQGYGAMSAMIR